MRTQHPIHGALVALLLAGLAACSEPPAPPAAGSEPAAAGPSRAPRTLPLPSPAGGEDSAGRLTWSVPAAWSEEPPATEMRFAQYRLPGPAGDAECIVHYFGARQGGDAQSNALRWARQFEQPDGSPSEERMSIERLDGTAVVVHVVEVTGTYDGGMTMTDAPAQKKPGYMLLGAIAEGPDAPWFFKLTGPEQTVRAQHDAFVELLRSLRVAS